MYITHPVRMLWRRSTHSTRMEARPTWPRPALHELRRHAGRRSPVTATEPAASHGTTTLRHRWRRPPCT
jgi:hypothetical protein